MIAYIDLKNVFSKEDLHKIIRDSFNFESYGNNFDSFYDNLSSQTSDVIIIVKNIQYVNQELTSYINIFKNVLNDLMVEFDNIIVKYE